MDTAPTRTTTSSLDEAVRQFVPLSKFADLLERHRDHVLNLKVRGASYAQIHDLLKSHGIVTSEPAIGRFCRKYRDELKRLRLLLEREGEPHFPPVAASPVSAPDATTSPSLPPPTLNPITPRPRKIRDLRGGV